MDDLAKTAKDSARVKRSWEKRRRKKKLRNHITAEEFMEMAGLPRPKVTLAQLAQREALLFGVAKKARSDAWLATHPNKKSAPKEIAGSHGHRPHGPSILWPALYEHLRAKGKSKAAAAAISNAAWKKKKVGMKTNTPTSVRGVVKSDDYEALIEKVRRVRSAAGAKRYGVPIGSPIPGASSSAVKRMESQKYNRKPIIPLPGRDADGKPLPQKKVPSSQQEWLYDKKSNRLYKNPDYKKPADGMTTERSVNRSARARRQGEPVRRPNVSGRQQRVSQLARRMRPSRASDTSMQLSRDEQDEITQELSLQEQIDYMKARKEKGYDHEGALNYAIIQGMKKAKGDVGKASPDASEVHMDKAMEKVMVGAMRRKRTKRMKGKGGKDC